MGTGKPGVLLVNLGTPEAPETKAVRRYLEEFLSDPRVLDLSVLGRWALLHLVILPFRPRRSAEAYRKIWTLRGSPLLFHSQDLAKALEEKLEGRFDVELAMRYGQPSLPSALEKLLARGVRELVVLPLYPQNAASSTGSTLDRVYGLLAQSFDVLPVRVVPPFFDHPQFLDAFAQVAKPHLEETKPDHVLFSFHGLPERHLKKGDRTGRHCLASASCCDVLSTANAGCYRAQAYATARGLVSRLGLAEGRWSVSFQSRLGRTPWISPYTDHVLPALAQKGIKRVAVMCPAFVADCLETLEEIGIRAREDFLQQGGEALTLVPSLNAHPAWVEAVAKLIQETHGGL